MNRSYKILDYLDMSTMNRIKGSTEDTNKFLFGNFQTPLNCELPLTINF